MKLRLPRAAALVPAGLAAVFGVTFGGGAQANPPAGDDAGRAAVVFQQGVDLDREGKFGPACEKFAEAVRLTPAWGLARYELAQCQRLLGDLEGDGLPHLVEAEKDLKRPPIYIERGRLLEDRGDRAGAMAAYKEALTLMPAEVRAQAGAARVTDPAEGKAALERVQTHALNNPTDAAAWRRVAEVAEAQKKWPIAEQALDKVIELSKNKRQAIAALGAFGQRAKKKDVVERALRMMPQ